MHMPLIYPVTIMWWELGTSVKMEKIRKFSFGNKSNVFDTVILHFANIHVEKTKGGFFFFTKFCRQWTSFWLLGDKSGSDCKLLALFYCSCIPIQHHSGMWSVHSKIKVPHTNGKEYNLLLIKTLLSYSIFKRSNIRDVY